MMVVLCICLTHNTRKGTLGILREVLADGIIYMRTFYAALVGYLSSGGEIVTKTSLPS
jgi:hypothetical protein